MKNLRWIYSYNIFYSVLCCVIELILYTVILGLFIYNTSLYIEYYIDVEISKLKIYIHIRRLIYLSFKFYENKKQNTENRIKNIQYIPIPTTYIYLRRKIDSGVKKHSRENLFEIKN